MKKLTIFLLIGLIALMTACSTTTQSPSPAITTTEAAAPGAAAPAAKPILVVSLPALDNPLMLAFQDAFKNTYGADFDVQVSSADGNANTQATQIENYTAMKPAFLFVMAVEPTSLVPKLEAARNAGVKVLFAGGDPGSEDAYDFCDEDEPVPIGRIRSVDGQAMGR